VCVCVRVCVCVCVCVCFDPPAKRNTSMQERVRLCDVNVCASLAYSFDDTVEFREFLAGGCDVLGVVVDEEINECRVLLRCGAAVQSSEVVRPASRQQ
jgi:hypothetical protein